MGSQARVQHLKQTAIEYQWGHGFTARQRASTTWRLSGNPVWKKISHSQMWWLSKRTREQLVVDLFRLKGELYKKTTTANSSGLIRNVCFWNPLDGFMWIPALLHDHWLPVKVVVPELQHRTEPGFSQAKSWSPSNNLGLNRAAEHS